MGHKTEKIGLHYLQSYLSKYLNPAGLEPPAVARNRLGRKIMMVSIHVMLISLIDYIDKVG